jgi:hypothetical protein
MISPDSGLDGYDVYGVENDALFYGRLSPQGREMYLKGQETFAASFWNENKETLEGFTNGLKPGTPEYVAGVIRRGRWLQQNYPYRSSPYNIPALVYDVVFGGPTTVGSGASPALRNVLLKLLPIED